MPLRQVKESKKGGGLLSAQHQLFVEEYLKDWEMDANKAALAAGYKSGNYGNQLTRNPQIQAAISKRA